MTPFLLGQLGAWLEGRVSGVGREMIRKLKIIIKKQESKLPTDATQ